MSLDWPVHNNGKEEIPCGFCKDLFVKKYPNSKYCSPLCKVRQGEALRIKRHKPKKVAPQMDVTANNSLLRGKW